MLPLSDMNPTRRFPVLTYSLIALNLLVFFWELSLPSAALEPILMDLSVVPANVSRSPFCLGRRPSDFADDIHCIADLGPP